MTESVWKMFRKVLYEAGQETLVEYLNKTSLNGCQLLYVIRRRKYQRLVWLIFIVLTIAFATYVCSAILSSFLRDPIVTTLDPHPYTIYEAPFPSVAVCSYNKFSRQMLWNYASNMYVRKCMQYTEDINWSISKFSSTWHNSRTNQTLKYWMKKLEILAGLYNYDSIDFEEAEQLQNELESILREEFVTSKILKVLAPSCSDLLVKCFWSGQVIDCQEQFELKMFLDGPCCVFNYQHQKNSDSLYYPNNTKPSTDLAFVVNASTDDYFYAENSAVGFYIKLFSTQFMPDMRLSDMVEFHVGVAEDVNVQLQLTSQVTSENTRVYSLQKRGCYFPYELAPATAYEQSKCMLKCKARTIERGCGCIPFYAASGDIELDGTDQDIGECSLLHLACLKFLRYELLDTSECTACYPSCSYNHYRYRKAVKPLNTGFPTYANLKYLPANANLTPDLSLVKIFYSSKIATKFNRNALYNWHHILSQIGGVMGICMGCSIVNGIEMIYFVGYRLIENFLKLRRTRLQLNN